MASSKGKESEPLLPTHTSSHAPSTSSSGTPRGKLQARRYVPAPTAEEGKGKGRAPPPLSDLDLEQGEAREDESVRERDEKGRRRQKGKGRGKGKGRCVTIIFSNESELSGGNLDVWVEDGENVGAVKDKVRHLRPSLQSLNLRLIHSGRLLTDGILFLPWLRALEERVRRQAQGVGGDVEEVLKDVGLAEGDSEEDGVESDPKEGSGEAMADGRRRSRSRSRSGEMGKGREKRKEKERVWLHCIVGGKEEKRDKAPEEEPSAPRRRGFDVLLDAGLSPADVAAMRRQFYESRGEEMPEADVGDVNDEHARALEEQWIEGDLTADTATTSTEGLYNSILHGLLTGFLLPLTPWFFFRELPLPNFFEAEAEARAQASALAQPSGLNGPVPLPPLGSSADASPLQASSGQTSHTSTSTSDGGRGRGRGTPVPTPPLSSPSAGSPTAAAAAAGTTTIATAPASTTTAPTPMSLAAHAGLVRGEAISSVVFGQRMQMGIVLGTLINIGFGALRFLN